MARFQSKHVRYLFQRLASWIFPQYIVGSWPSTIYHQVIYIRHFHQSITHFLCDNALHWLVQSFFTDDELLKHACESSISYLIFVCLLGHICHDISFVSPFSLNCPSLLCFPDVWCHHLMVAAETIRMHYISAVGTTRIAHFERKQNLLLSSLMHVLNDMIGVLWCCPYFIAPVDNNDAILLIDDVMCFFLLTTFRSPWSMRNCVLLLVLP